ncbi:hypothetical protein HYH03_006007 [Edaphochlamys debaryana]|uniref:Uncharacterized protein n=1 Tax=Edaphochlamys debaryana TaxID=47281 RepID=A0A835Y6R0_9CHLO|nr:hypothetical protein HYH03_006007 [Edaphochlamys debaryana]|eukprot:KAG2495758.1 hypothetical protein HYH03_006007 [Edaphochlamys debaryana]
MPSQRLRSSAVSSVAPSPKDAPGATNGRGRVSTTSRPHARTDGSSHSGSTGHSSTHRDSSSGRSYGPNRGSSSSQGPGRESRNPDSSAAAADAPPLASARTERTASRVPSSAANGTARPTSAATCGASSSTESRSRTDSGSGAGRATSWQAWWDGYEAEVQSAADAKAVEAKAAYERAKAAVEARKAAAAAAAEAEAKAAAEAAKAGPGPSSSAAAAAGGLGVTPARIFRKPRASRLPPPDPVARASAAALAMTSHDDALAATLAALSLPPPNRPPPPSAAPSPTVSYDTMTVPAEAQAAAAPSPGPAAGLADALRATMPAVEAAEEAARASAAQAAPGPIRLPAPGPMSLHDRQDILDALDTQGRQDGAGVEGAPVQAGAEAGVDTAEADTSDVVSEAAGDLSPDTDPDALPDYVDPDYERGRLDPGRIRSLYYVRDKVVARLASSADARLLVETITDSLPLLDLAGCREAFRMIRVAASSLVAFPSNAALVQRPRFLAAHHWVARRLAALLRLYGSTALDWGFAMTVVSGMAAGRCRDPELLSLVHDRGLALVREAVRAAGGGGGSGAAAEAEAEASPSPGSSLDDAGGAAAPGPGSRSWSGRVEARWPQRRRQGSGGGSDEEGEGGAAGAGEVGGISVRDLVSRFLLPLAQLDQPIDKEFLTLLDHMLAPNLMRAQAQAQAAEAGVAAAVTGAVAVVTAAADKDQPLWQVRDVLELYGKLGMPPSPALAAALQRACERAAADLRGPAAAVVAAEAAAAAAELAAQDSARLAAKAGGPRGRPWGGSPGGSAAGGGGGPAWRPPPGQSPAAAPGPSVARLSQPEVDRAEVRQLTALAGSLASTLYHLGAARAAAAATAAATAAVAGDVAVDGGTVQQGPDARPGPAAATGPGAQAGDEWAWTYDMYGALQPWLGALSPLQVSGVLLSASRLGVLERLLQPPPVLQPPALQQTHQGNTTPAQPPPRAPRAFVPAQSAFAPQRPAPYGGSAPPPPVSPFLESYLSAVDVVLMGPRAKPGNGPATATIGNIVEALTGLAAAKTGGEVTGFGHSGTAGSRGGLVLPPSRRGIVGKLLHRAISVISYSYTQYNGFVPPYVLSALTQVAALSRRAAAGDGTAGGAVRHVIDVPARLVCDFMQLTERLLPGRHADGLAKLAAAAAEMRWVCPPAGWVDTLYAALAQRLLASARTGPYSAAAPDWTGADRTGVDGAAAPNAAWMGPETEVVDGAGDGLDQASSAAVSRSVDEIELTPPMPMPDGASGSGSGSVSGSGQEVSESFGNGRRLYTDVHKDKYRYPPPDQPDPLAPGALLGLLRASVGLARAAFQFSAAAAPAEVAAAEVGILPPLLAARLAEMLGEHLAAGRLTAVEVAEAVKFVAAAPGRQGTFTWATIDDVSDFVTSHSTAGSTALVILDELVTRQAALGSSSDSDGAEGDEGPLPTSDSPWDAHRTSAIATASSNGNGNGNGWANAAATSARTGGGGGRDARLTDARSALARQVRSRIIGEGLEHALMLLLASGDPAVVARGSPSLSASLSLVLGRAPSIAWQAAAAQAAVSRAAAAAAELRLRWRESPTAGAAAAVAAVSAANEALDLATYGGGVAVPSDPAWWAEVSNAARTCAFLCRTARGGGAATVGGGGSAETGCTVEELTDQLVRYAQHLGRWVDAKRSHPTAAAVPPAADDMADAGADEASFALPAADADGAAAESDDDDAGDVIQAMTSDAGAKGDAVTSDPGALDAADAAVADGGSAGGGSPLRRHLSFLIDFFDMLHLRCLRDPAAAGASKSARIAAKQAAAARARADSGTARNDEQQGRWERRAAELEAAAEAEVTVWPLPAASLVRLAELLAVSRFQPLRFGRLARWDEAYMERVGACLAYLTPVDACMLARAVAFQGWRPPEGLLDDLLERARADGGLAALRTAYGPAALVQLLSWLGYSRFLPAPEWMDELCDLLQPALQCEQQCDITWDGDGGEAMTSETANAAVPPLGLAEICVLSNALVELQYRAPAAWVCTALAAASRTALVASAATIELPDCDSTGSAATDDARAAAAQVVNLLHHWAWLAEESVRPGGGAVSVADVSAVAAAAGRFAVEMAEATAPLLRSLEPRQLVRCAEAMATLTTLAEAEQVPPPPPAPSAPGSLTAAEVGRAGGGGGAAADADDAAAALTSAGGWRGSISGSGSDSDSGSDSSDGDAAAPPPAQAAAPPRRQRLQQLPALRSWWLEMEQATANALLVQPPPVPGSAAAASPSPAPPTALAPAAVAAAAKLPPQLTPYHLSVTLRSMAVAGHAASDGWLQRYCLHTAPLLPTYLPIDLAASLWALARMRVTFAWARQGPGGVQPGPGDGPGPGGDQGARTQTRGPTAPALGAWMEAAVAALGHVLHRCNGKDLQHSMWALASMGFPPPSGWLARFEAATAFRLLPGPDVGPIGASRAGGGRAARRPPAEQPQKAQHGRRSRQAVEVLEPPAVLYGLWACGKFGHAPAGAYVEAALEALLPSPAAPAHGPAPARPPLDGQSLGLLLHALAQLGYSPSDEWVERCLRALLPLLPSMTATGLSITLRALASLQVLPSALWLDAALASARRRLPALAARPEQLEALLSALTEMLGPPPSQPPQPPTVASSRAAAAPAWGSGSGSGSWLAPADRPDLPHLRPFLVECISAAPDNRKVGAFYRLLVSPPPPPVGREAPQPPPPSRQHHPAPPPPPPAVGPQAHTPQRPPQAQARALERQELSPRPQLTAKPAREPTTALERPQPHAKASTGPGPEPEEPHPAQAGGAATAAQAAGKGPKGRGPAGPKRARVPSVRAGERGKGRAGRGGAAGGGGGRGGGGLGPSEG